MSTLLKVKFFGWLMLRGNVVVKEILQRSRICQALGSVCAICGDGPKSISYLFLHCRRIYKLWSRVANL